MENKAETNIAPNWIYGDIWASPEKDMLEAVEKALGFKLFYWQKTFIAYGKYRRAGFTTAEILRELLSEEETPIIWKRRPASNMEAVYRHDLLKIKEKLDAAGIKTREIKMV